MRRPPCTITRFKMSWLLLVSSLLLWNDLILRVDAFAHPMFHSYNTYPIARNNPEQGADSTSAASLLTADTTAPVGDTPNPLQTKVRGSIVSFSSSQQQQQQQQRQQLDPNHNVMYQKQLQELQHQVTALLEDRQRLQDELKLLQHDYQVDVTALADRIEELMRSSCSSMTRSQQPISSWPTMMRPEEEYESQQEHSYPTQPLLEFRARDSDDYEGDEEDDVDTTLEEGMDPIDQKLLELSTKGMLLTQRSSLRTKLRGMASDVRSNLMEGVFSLRRRSGSSDDNHQNNSDDSSTTSLPFTVTIEESLDNPDIPLPEL